MIILDSSILRSFAPDSSSADLLLTLRATGTQRVGVPWMVMEELAAQQAIKYLEKYEAAAQALKSLQQVTPGSPTVDLPPCDPEDVRDYWREKWGVIFETIPVSEHVMRQALFREANSLPPCKTSKGEKTGSRDAVIWLSAVQYARQNPAETVYFASANTKDFGDGTDYPAPMNRDLRGIEDRFVHWTNLDQAVAEFAKPAETNEDRVAELLATPATSKQAQTALQAGGYLPTDGCFQCTALMPSGEWWAVPAFGWTTHETVVGYVEAPQRYRIADQEWYSAKVHWYLTGTVNTDEGPAAAGCHVAASMLFTPDADDLRLTVLRADWPQPLGLEVLNTLALPTIELSMAERFNWMQRHSRPDLHPYRGPRSYEGAVLRSSMLPDSLKADNDAPFGG
ncbi:DUF4935 domain-containing protein [Streptomyces sp. M2CJ-2]|uniref:PIN domain-containing protein n=1 Tax=Streptomyces sp. M2CJ-2 TaxID=2803948 RepID=UPI0019287959|nr:PIN domain-containing protein [Streptomyces sp. M2CJ-2]MBL3670964.1 DUF4935 domain-containing protein [Streptomyces sp. M2CJ-2]